MDILDDHDAENGWTGVFEAPYDHPRPRSDSGLQMHVRDEDDFSVFSEQPDYQGETADSQLGEAANGEESAHVLGGESPDQAVSSGETADSQLSEATNGEDSSPVDDGGQDSRFHAMVRATLAKYSSGSHTPVNPERQEVARVDVAALKVPPAFRNWLKYQHTLELDQRPEDNSVGANCYIRDKAAEKSEPHSEPDSLLDSSPWDLVIVDKQVVITEGVLVKACTQFRKPTKPSPQIRVVKFWLVTEAVAAEVRAFLAKKAERKKQKPSDADASAKGITGKLGPCLCLVLPNTDEEQKELGGGSESNSVSNSRIRRRPAASVDDVEDSIFRILVHDDGLLSATGVESEDARDLKQTISEGVEKLLHDLRSRHREEGRWPDFVLEKGFLVPLIGDIFEQAMEEGNLPGVVSERRVMAGDFDPKREIKSLLLFVEIYLLWFKSQDDRMQQLEDAVKRLDAGNGSRADCVRAVERTILGSGPGPAVQVWRAKFDFAPRPYQLEAIAQCIASNTIVCLDTGTGKTLIAIHVIDHFLRTDDVKTALFIVPTTALVTQQAQSIRRRSQTLPVGGSEDQCFTTGVAELSGVEMDRWTERHWQGCLSKNRVLVGTPAIFEKALVTTGFLDVTALSVIVFDECHHAVGNSPMAVIMRSAVARVEAEQRPRIVGLTASFINGAVSDRTVVTKREELCKLLQSNILAPEVPEEQQREFVAVAWEPTRLTDDDAAAIADVFVKPLLDAMQEVQRVREQDKVLRSATHVLLQLGFEGFRYYMMHGLAVEVEAIATNLVSLGTHNAPRAQRVLDRIADIREQLEGRFEHLSQSGTTETAEEWTKKAEKLVEVVKAQSGGQGIVFCAQNCLAHPLKYLLLTHDVAADAVAGVSHMTRAKKDAVLRKFRSKNISLLVSTNAAEEGLDVPACQFVIRFDKFSTTKSHIQGSGRARTEGARIYYMDNDLALEKQKEELLKTVATDASLGMDDDLLLAADTAAIPGKYPFPPDVAPGSGTVVFSNCLQILLEFCVKALSDTVQLAEFLRFERAPDSPQQVLKACRFPSPDGWGEVSLADVDAYWGDAALGGLMRKRERAQEMRFVFVVVVQLRSLGLLDHRNQPVPDALDRCRDKCPRPAFQSGIKLCPKFNQNDTLVAQTQAAWTGDDYKGRLNLWCQHTYKDPSICVYQDLALGAQGPYVSTVTVTPPVWTHKPAMEFRGKQAFGKKKDAQQAAAKEAWDQLSLLEQKLPSTDDDAAAGMAGLSLPASPGWTGDDFKGRLNLWCQQNYRLGCAGMIQYEDVAAPPQGFVSTVTVKLPSPAGPQTFRGLQAFSKKKDAQQAAAKEACESLCRVDEGGVAGGRASASPPVSQSPAGARTTTSPGPGSPGEDYKSLLNREQKNVGTVCYQTGVGAGGQFVCTAVVVGSGERFVGPPSPAKKAAEQAAAKVAWEHLVGGGKSA